MDSMVRAGGHSVKRPADRQREWWDRAQTEVRARLARIDRGESWAPAQVVRCLRVFAAPEARR